MRYAKLLRQILRLAVIRIFDVHYRVIDPAIQGWRLRDYDGDVRSIIHGAQCFDGGAYAILVYYELQDGVSGSVTNLLDELGRAGINVLLVSNRPLSPAQEEIIRPRTWSIMIRGNQGLDFGAYKDAVHHLQAIDAPVARLLLLNDSVYYFREGLAAFVQGLLGREDVVAAFENWDARHEYHIQSFALSVSDVVWRHEAFRRFWRDYVPHNSRLMAIERGEKRLSRACLAAARSTRVLYSYADLYEALGARPPALSEEEFAISAPIHMRDRGWGSTVVRDGGRVALHGGRRDAIMEGSSIGSPLHTSLHYFARLLNCPLVKKDLVYRQQYRLWEVETLLRPCFSEEQVVEYLTMVRTKGDIRSQRLMRRIKAGVGAA